MRSLHVLTSALRATFLNSNQIWPSMKNALSGYYGQRRLFCLGDRSFGPWVEHEISVLIGSRVRISQDSHVDLSIA